MPDAPDPLENFLPEELAQGVSRQPREPHVCTGQVTLGVSDRIAQSSSANRLGQ